jgi:formylglycine-generating enzyme required for sulfatase activity
MTLKQLTKEQEARLPFYTEKWLKIGLSTEQSTPEQREAAITLAYECAELKPPKQFIHVSSPMAVQKKANELGLFDMSGNVFEWIEDLWDATYRHIRGGSFRSGAEECRVFYRDKADQTKRVDNLGFRIVKVASARNKAHSW